MTLPADRFVTLIQTFTQEMSLMIRAYGGYILKYVGNAIAAFSLLIQVICTYLVSMQ